MSLPIYIAGGSSEFEICQRMISAVVEAGGRITFDWTLSPEWGLGRSLTPAERRAAANVDLAAVIDARLFWLVLPYRLSEGAHVELGAALALRALGREVEVIVSGPMHASRLFHALADRVFADHEEALAYVVGRCRGGSTLPQDAAAVVPAPEGASMLGEVMMGRSGGAGEIFDPSCPACVSTHKFGDSPVYAHRCGRAAGPH